MEKTFVAMIVFVSLAIFIRKLSADHAGGCCSSRGCGESGKAKCRCSRWLQGGRLPEGKV